jgi:hypothetical protein
MSFAMLIMCRAISLVCFSSLAKSPCTWQKSHFCPNAAANERMVGIKFSSAGSNFKFFGAGCCPKATTASSNAVKVSLIADYYDTLPAVGQDAILQRVVNPRSLRRLVTVTNLPQTHYSRSAVANLVLI